jgi:hypothetical protein
MKYIIFLLFFVSKFAIAKDYPNGFHFKHRTCAVKFIENPTHPDKFKKALYKLIKSRNLSLEKFSKHAKVFEGDLYFTIDLMRAKSGFYKNCEVKVVLKIAKSRQMGSKDKVLASKKITRKFPRLTMHGNERCIKALKDAFVHVPKCKKPL